MWGRLCPPCALAIVERYPPLFTQSRALFGAAPALTPTSSHTPERESAWLRPIAGSVFESPYRAFLQRHALLNSWSTRAPVVVAVCVYAGRATYQDSQGHGYLWPEGRPRPRQKTPNN